MDSFFLGGATLVLAPPSQKGPVRVNGLVIIDNTWANYNMPHNTTVVIDERRQKFTQPPLDMVMLGNIGDGRMAPRAITVTRSLYMAKSTQWVFDFSDVFLFPSVPIVEATYSITTEEGCAWARHTLRPPKGQTVTVETDVHVSATVTVTATQGEFSVGNRGGLRG